MAVTPKGPVSYALTALTPDQFEVLAFLLAHEEFPARSTSAKTTTAGTRVWPTDKARQSAGGRPRLHRTDRLEPMPGLRAAGDRLLAAAHSPEAKLPETGVTIVSADATNQVRVMFASPATAPEPSP